MLNSSTIFHQPTTANVNRNLHTWIRVIKITHSAKVPPHRRIRIVKNAISRSFRVQRREAEFAPAEMVGLLAHVVADAKVLGLVDCYVAAVPDEFLRTLSAYDMSTGDNGKAHPM